MVDSNVSVMWKEKNREKITPLRNWEKNEKFQSSFDVKLSRGEKMAILKDSIPLIIAFIITVFVFVLDFTLVTTMRLLEVRPYPKGSCYLFLMFH